MNIVFANPKGGAGKSTAALVLATELALETKVAVVDADVRKRIQRWVQAGNAPANLVTVGEVTEKNVIDCIDAAAQQAGVVIVDTEGTASVTVLLAISRADLVVIPLQDSAPDAEEAAEVIKVIRTQERVGKRKIPFVIAPTRTPAAYRSRIMKYVLEQLAPTGARVLEVELVERAAFKALWVYEAPLEALPSNEVPGLDKAIENARAYAQAVVKLMSELASADQSQQKEAA